MAHKRAMSASYLHSAHGSWLSMMSEERSWAPISPFRTPGAKSAWWCSWPTGYRPAGGAMGGLKCWPGDRPCRCRGPGPSGATLRSGGQRMPVRHAGRAMPERESGPPGPSELTLRPVRPGEEAHHASEILRFLHGDYDFDFFRICFNASS